jgi:protein gp37
MMAKNTPIEWTDHSWPVLNGCRRKSEGCRNCYAERLISTRLRHTEKYKGLAVYTEGGPRWTGESRLWAADLEMPLRLRKPSRIFVADMGDLFFEGNPNQEIAAVFGVMAAAPQHTFQVLTKRPERAAEWFKWIGEVGGIGPWLRANWSSVRDLFAGGARFTTYRGRKVGSKDAAGAMVLNAAGVQTWPLPNVHLGVSAEDQATYNDRVPILVHKCPAEAHWVSLEPQLGPIELRGTGHIHLAWVVQGGESGPGARPFDIEWARSMRDECAESGISYFLKQLGGNHFAPSKVQWVEGHKEGSIEAVFFNHKGIRSELATVWPNGVWHTWDERGIGGENSQEPTVELAKSAALAAMRRQHVAPYKGWARHGHMLRNRKGNDMAEWPEDLRLREFPETRP